MKAEMPRVYHLLTAVPQEDRPQGEELVNFWQTVAVELASLLGYSNGAEQPQAVFRDFRRGGEQYIWEFWVNDLSTPAQSEYNWHGQNTSQWRYAGAIVLQNGRVSSHH